MGQKYNPMTASRKTGTVITASIAAQNLGANVVGLLYEKCPLCEKLLSQGVAEYAAVALLMGGWVAFVNFCKVKFGWFKVESK